MRTPPRRRADLLSEPAVPRLLIVVESGPLGEDLDRKALIGLNTNGDNGGRQGDPAVEQNARKRLELNEDRARSPRQAFARTQVERDSRPSPVADRS